MILLPCNNNLRHGRFPHKVGVRSCKFLQCSFGLLLVALDKLLTGEDFVSGITLPSRLVMGFVSPSL